MSREPGDEFADLVIGWVQDGAPADPLAARLDEAVAASVDRASYDAARKQLVQWMTARGVPEFKREAALQQLRDRVRVAAGEAAA